MTTSTLEREPLTPAPASSAARAAFVALLLRDLRVVRKTWVAFLMRTVMQPFFMVFVFAYVFPKIGQGIGGNPAAESRFATLLAPGIIASATIFQGVQAVTLPLVNEFGFTREIEDRVMAPLAIRGIGMAKIVSGAIQAALAGIVVFPMLVIVPLAEVRLDITWPMLLTIAPLSCLLAGSLGLALGTVIEPRQVPLMFSIIIMPMMMLGCVYYSWSSLEALPVLQWLVLFNPLVYMSEGFRMAMTNLEHMNGMVIYAALIGATAALMRIGLSGFRRRVTA